MSLPVTSHAQLARTSQWRCVCPLAGHDGAIKNKRLQSTCTSLTHHESRCETNNVSIADQNAGPGSIPVTMSALMLPVLHLGLKRFQITGSA